MKGISIRLEDPLHRRLKRVTFENEVSVQDFVCRLLKMGIEEAEKEMKREEEHK